MPIAGNYEDLIKDLMRRTEEDRMAAEARGKSEAQRRGLVSGTGTSDIEMALRRAQTEPVVRAGQSNIAQILANIAEQQEARKYQTSEREAAQRHGTSEREAAQRYGTSEREASQQFSRAEAEALRKWQTGERMSTQDWQALEDAKQRTWATGEREAGQTWQGKMAGYIDPNTGQWKTGKWMGHTVSGAGLQDVLSQQTAAHFTPKPKKKSGWKSALGGLSGAGGYALGSWLSPGGWWGG